MYPCLTHDTSDVFHDDVAIIASTVAKLAKIIPALYLV